MKTLPQLLLLLLLFAFFACKQPPAPPDPVVVFEVDSTIEGILPYNWWGNPILAPGLDGKMAGLAGDNTLFQIADSSDNDNYLFLYKAAQGNEVRLVAEEDFVFINEQIHSAYWDEENHEAFARRIDQTSDEELASFSLLRIGLTDSSKVAPILSRIIQANPGIVIFTEKPSDAIQDLIATTQPELLLIDNELIQNPSRMDLSRVRSLVYRKPTSSLNQLKGLELPALESFCFFLPEMDTTEFFVPEYPQVSSLSMVTTGYYPSNLSAYPELSSLCLFVGDSLSGKLDSLPHPEKLRALNVSGYLDALTGVEKVQNLQHLRLTYGEVEGDEVTGQALMETFIQNNPSLVYLDISEAMIRSLEPVRGLKQLRYLAMPPAEKLSGMSLEPLRELPELAYIGIYREDEEGEAEVLAPIEAELQNICPNCSIYYHEGFSLGRGWLLLFLPLLLALLAVKKWL